jgi:hypothetical protein
MKFRIHFVFSLVACFAASSASLSAAAAESPKAPAPAAKPDAVEQEIPRSMFTIPTNHKEGRDPFFPNSTIANSAPVARTNPTVALAPTKMILMGISGTPQKRLAIINGRTFEKGEEEEIPSVNGKVKVRCLEIKEETVIISVNGERQELRMRPGL